jgi:hypothetical protein
MTIKNFLGELFLNVEFKPINTGLFLSCIGSIYLITLNQIQPALLILGLIVLLTMPAPFGIKNNNEIDETDILKDPVKY